VYVVKGSAEIEGKPAVSGDAVFVEHGAHATLKVGGDGAELIHFLSTALEPAPTLAGGHVHIIGDTAETKPRPEPSAARPDVADPNAKPARMLRYLLSDCPTCTLWLHRSDRPFSSTTKQHAHSASEIIYLLRGEMNFGSQKLLGGGAVAIDLDTRYGFVTGQEGVEFINFRPAASVFTRYDENGKVISVGGGE
jgi:hypothetical protein